MKSVVFYCAASGWWLHVALVNHASLDRFAASMLLAAGLFGVAALRLSRGPR